MTHKRFLILNRWDDEFAEYHRYISHTENTVAYITTEAGLSRIDRHNAVAVEVLEAIEPSPVFFEAGRRIKNQLGGLDGIVCLSEFDLLTAAQLRAKLEVPGLLPSTVERFKDKTVMKTAILAANLPAPLYVEVSDRQALEALITKVGFPIILKPKVGAASAGVSRVDSQQQLNNLLSQIDINNFECEQYIAGQIYHIDGLVRNGVLQFVKPSRYINTCYDFAQGKPLGSIVMSPSPKTENLIAFTDSCLQALELSNGAFHLEVIENQHGELYFLEIGARVGGGEIPFIHCDLFGVDLVGEWLRIQFDLPPINLSGANQIHSGGFLMIPEPHNSPCEIIKVTSLINFIPEIYREIIPQPGDVLDGKGGYEHISGRFHFKGAEEGAVEAAIYRAIDLFRIEIDPKNKTNSGVR
jgi:hypothetical protein